MKRVLTIAGSDCSGGGGIQADIKTMSSLGVYAMSVIVSVVAENTCGVISKEKLSAKSIGEQIDAVIGDIGVDAIKIGMLTDTSIAVVADKLIGLNVPVVIDPVMQAKDGTPLIDADISEYVRKILPLATVFTPNIPESECITGTEITSIEDMKVAARKMAAMGAKTVLVKGGHSVGEATDVFFDGEFHLFSAKRISTRNTHGTGCTLSSAIASFLAKGKSPCESVELAKEYITSAIASSLPLGKGNGPLNHFFAFAGDKPKFDPTLYLCTDRSHLQMPIEQCVEKAILGGVTAVQLREKQCTSKEFVDMGFKIRKITASHGVTLIVNDRVDVALAIGADGVHLGQSDLDCRTARKIVGDRMIIGVTAHSVLEATEAERAGADYIGVGAMATTGTKSDARLLPKGELEAIRRAVKLPIVIIGGINAQNVASFIGRGADGIAVSSAIMSSADPKSSAKELREIWTR